MVNGELKSEIIDENLESLR